MKKLIILFLASVMLFFQSCECFYDSGTTVKFINQYNSCKKIVHFNSPQAAQLEIDQWLQIENQKVIIIEKSKKIQISK
jgi:uncharacterized protein YktA (UPF0223 family)